MRGIGKSLMWQCGNVAMWRFPVFIHFRMGKDRFVRRKVIVWGGETICLRF